MPSYSPTHYLSNLRTTLTALVITHHTAIPYGGTGSWSLYTSRFAHHKPFASLPLVSFNVINQTFFMALFFLVSGYFSAASAAKIRKSQSRGERTGGGGRSAFLKTKWKRLGVPTLLYTMLGPALTRALSAVVRDGVGAGEVGRRVWEEVMRTRGVRGAVWYCGVLLIFDGVYALLFPGHFSDPGAGSGERSGTGTGIGNGESAKQSARQSLKARQEEGYEDEDDLGIIQPLISKQNQPQHQPQSLRHHNSNTQTAEERDVKHQPTIPHILTALLLTTLTSFLLRIPYPSGIRSFSLLGLTPGYLPQYILFYSTGIAASTTYKCALHELVTRRTRTVLGLTVLLVNLVGCVVVYSSLVVGQAGGGAERGGEGGGRVGGEGGGVGGEGGTGGAVQALLPSFRGGFNRFAILYALWNETTGIWLSSLILLWFHATCKVPWKLGSVDVARYSYPAFLCHIPVVVFWQCVVDGWDAGGVLKTVVVAVPSVLGSWGVGWVLVWVVEGVGCRGYI
ncbi:hypothetical protein K491DRAFT_690323 [Lophiostoma macrostomum CBS 122681]|uniref:Acyltransferase 3 domain-containing protein n=1 Tax=Lophiostoma macrostomum CBS 122681 TaxID=1314788 RepID=A0A6A6TFS7_9PLEO|nr:hypothetical protein K491DRAFT_690323 [Lophiostoma macrostomum CBS 122681]